MGIPGTVTKNQLQLTKDTLPRYSALFTVCIGVSNCHGGIEKVFTFER